MIDPITTYTDIAAVDTTPTLSQSFAYSRTDGAGVSTWVCPGPVNDLSSRRVLKRMAQKTKAGIVGRTVHLTIPVLNGSNGKYDRSIQVRLTLNAPSVVDIDECRDALFYTLNLFRGTDSLAGFAGEFVKAADLPI